MPREIGAGHSPFGALEFVPEPLKNRHRNRFTRFQNHVADESVAYDHFDGVLEQMTALDVADEVERTLLQHLEDFLGLLGAFHVLFAERYQAYRRILVAENVARINRAHERVLKEMFWALRVSLKGVKLTVLGRILSPM